MKDMGDVIRKVEYVHLEDNMWLVTLDVQVLYTCTVHADSLEMDIWISNIGSDSGQMYTEI